MAKDVSDETDLTDAEAEAILLGLSPALVWTMKAYPTAHGTLFVEVAWSDKGRYEVRSCCYWDERWEARYCPWLPPLWEPYFFTKSAVDGKVRGSSNRFLPYLRQDDALAACERHHSAGHWMPPLPPHLSNIRVWLLRAKAAVLLLTAAYCFFRIPSASENMAMPFLLLSGILSIFGVMTLEYVKKATTRTVSTSATDEDTGRQA